MKRITCPNCHGSGYRALDLYDDAAVKCPICHGQKWVWEMSTNIMKDHQMSEANFRVITISAKNGIEIDEKATSAAEAEGIFEAQQCFSDTLAVYTFDQHGMYVRGWSAEAEELAVTLGYWFSGGWTATESIQKFEKAKEVFNAAQNRGYAGGAFVPPGKPPLTVPDPEPEEETPAKGEEEIKLNDDMSLKGCIKRLTEWRRFGSLKIPEEGTKGRNQFEADLDVVINHTIGEELLPKSEEPVSSIFTPEMIDRINEHLNRVDRNAQARRALGAPYSPTGRFFEDPYELVARMIGEGRPPRTVGYTPEKPFVAFGNMDFSEIEARAMALLGLPVKVNPNLPPDYFEIWGYDNGRYYKGEKSFPYSGKLADWMTQLRNSAKQFETRPADVDHPHQPIPFRVSFNPEVGAELVPPVQATLYRLGEVVSSWNITHYGQTLGVSLGAESSEEVVYDRLTLRVPSLGEFNRDWPEGQTIVPGQTHRWGRFEFDQG